jgi:uncharacterized DUF497 family protein
VKILNGQVLRIKWVRFEWDEAKYAVNLRKHGVKFEEAAEVFFDLLSVYDDVSVNEEDRETILGFSFSLNILLVVFVERDVRTRITSARPATSREEREYAEKNFGK